MMGLCARSASALYDDYLLALERLHETRFSLGGEVFAMRGEARISHAATLSAAAAGIAIATKLGLKVPNMPTHAVPKVDGPEAVYALAFGEPTIRNLDRCGILEQLIPELEVCKTLMPRDAAHSYTVFEHTLRVIRNLDSLNTGSFYGDLKESLPDIGPLYLAALLHDLGKIDNTRPHSESGAEIAARICGEWGLAKPTAADVEWLVREHLQMAHLVRMRDPQVPGTIEEFLQIVSDRERLDMLTLLTWADIGAVSDEAWSTGQEPLLRELYYRTSAALEQDLGQPDGRKLPSWQAYRKRLLSELRREPVPEEEVHRFVESLPIHYLASTPSDLVRAHMNFVQTARAGTPVVELYQDPEFGTDVTICCLDRHGLLSEVLGVIYAYDLSVHSIRACTTQSDPAVALDSFALSYGGRQIPAATAKQLTQAIEGVLRDTVSAEEILTRHGKDPARKQQTLTYVFLAGNPSILEIQAPRGRGMAYRISRLLAREGWDITGARVGQWAGRGTAAFYVMGTESSPLSQTEIDRVFASQV